MLILSLTSTAVRVQASDGPRVDHADRKDKAVEPTHWGKVSGQVYDAATGAPLDQASIQIQHEGQFEDKGRSVGHTDAGGRYHCEGMLGRVSSNLDIGRFITNMLVPFGGYGTHNATKRVDISRLTVRVEKAGYHSFEGVVMCRELQPKSFAVTMEPILLTPVSSSEASAAAEGWGMVRIESVAIEPPFPKPDSKAILTVRVLTPRVMRIREMQVTCQSTLWGNCALRPARQTTKGEEVFTGEFKTPHVKQGLCQPLIVSLTRCPYDIAQGGASRHLLLQVVTTPEEEQSAAVRAAAYDHLASSEITEGVSALKSLCAQPTPARLDVAQLGAGAMQIKDYPTAVSARRQYLDMVSSEPETTRLAALTLYAQALLANGQADQAIREVAPIIEAVRERERPKKIPARLMVALGDAYLQAGNLAQASAVQEQLANWNITSIVPGWTQFHNALRLAQTKGDLNASPNSALAHASYGRVLMDQGRWEEAVQELQTAQQLDPNVPALRRDLAYALLPLQGSKPVSPTSLEDAIVEAEKQTVIVKGKTQTKSKDFFAWHSLGMLLYTQMRRQQVAGGPRAEEIRIRCQEAFIEALKCGRTGAVVHNGHYSPLFGYTSTRVVEIAGFAYPEANSVFLIRESLKALRQNSEDYLALFNLGTALVDLGYADLAADPIHRVLRTHPDMIEAQYVNALIDLQQGKRTTAIDELLAVTKGNPRHAMAWNKLARIYAEDGDLTAAAACLTAHTKVYGTAQPEVSE